MVNRLTARGTQAWAVPDGQRLTIERLAGAKDLRGYLKAFLLTCKVNELSPHTIECYDYKIGAFISFCHSLGVNDPAQVTVDDVRQFILHLQENNNSVSVSDYYKCVKRFFNWLVGEDVLESSPMAKIRPPKVEHKVIMPFRPEQLKTLLKFCDPNTFCGLRNRALILTFVDTGVRLEEMWKMSIEDLDLERGVIKVHGKGAKERVVSLGIGARKALLCYLLSRDDRYPCVWVTEERRPLTYDGLAMIFKTLKERADFSDVRCSAHTFRHTFATRALMNGASEFEVQSLLGHSTLIMTRRYAATLKSEQAIIAHKKFSPVVNLKLE